MRDLDNSNKSETEKRIIHIKSEIAHRNNNKAHTQREKEKEEKLHIVTKEQRQRKKTSTTLHNVKSP